jgi:hypothetical protein
MALTSNTGEGTRSAQRILRCVELASPPTMTPDKFLLLHRVDTQQTTAPVFVAGNTDTVSRNTTGRHAPRPVRPAEACRPRLSECGFGVCAHDPDCRDRLCPGAAAARKLRDALMDEAVRLGREADADEQASARQEIHKLDRQAGQLSTAVVIGFLLLILALASSQSIAEFVRGLLAR